MISEDYKICLINKLILHLGNDGFRFLNENNLIANETNSNKNKNIVSGIVVNALLGIVYGPFSWSSPSTDDTLHYDLKSLSECGAISGFKKQLGFVYI